MILSKKSSPLDPYWTIDYDHGALRFSLGSDASHLSVYAAQFPAGEWFHFAITRGENVAGGAEIFINGGKETEQLEYDADSLSIHNAAPITIGQDVDSGLHNFHGSLASLHIAEGVWYADDFDVADELETVETTFGAWTFINPNWTVPSRTPPMTSTTFVFEDPFTRNTPRFALNKLEPTSSLPRDALRQSTAAAGLKSLSPPLSKHFLYGTSRVIPLNFADVFGHRSASTSKSVHWSLTRRWPQLTVEIILIKRTMSTRLRKVAGRFRLGALVPNASKHMNMRGYLSVLALSFSIAGCGGDSTNKAATEMVSIAPQPSLMQVKLGHKRL